MKVCVALEQRFYRTPDGAVWTDGPCARPFWDRYLEVFDEVQAIALALVVLTEQRPGWNDYLDRIAAKIGAKEIADGLKEIREEDRDRLVRLGLIT